LKSFRAVLNTRMPPPGLSNTKGVAGPRPDINRGLGRGTFAGPRDYHNAIGRKYLAGTQRVPTFYSVDTSPPSATYAPVSRRPIPSLPTPP
jgi:hypothetical protein